MDIEWSFCVVIILSPWVFLFLYFYFFYGYLLTKLTKFSYSHSFPCVMHVSGRVRRKCYFVFWQTDTISTRYLSTPKKLQASAKLEIKFLVKFHYY